MEKYRAIPQGYMTVGALAKRMNTTVRTLQYYDKEGLLSPSAESEGGRRLYTDKDIILLHQIQSMKYLGFSLDDIKNRLVSLDTPADVADALAEQAGAIQEKIAALTEVLQAIDKLRLETLQMNTVDFKKYADIVVNLQLKNDSYGLIKHLDSEVLDHIRNRLDVDSSTAIINTLNRLCDELMELHVSGMPPESEQGQALAKSWWDMVMEFAGGDMRLLPNLMDISKDADSWNKKWGGKWAAMESYLQKAFETYFSVFGINPFEDRGK